MKAGRTPYGLPIIQSCLSCPVREDSLFCDLESDALHALNAIRRPSVFPKGALLFVEGQPCAGLFVICAGQAKLTASSSQGRSVIVRVAGAGEILGLSAVMSETPYEVSAETLQPTEVNFLPQEEFLRFLQYLSQELQRAYHQMARIALAPTAKAKLAGLLLDWASSQSASRADNASFQLRLTHEEIGQLIGTSRETVTRLLNELRRHGLIKTNGRVVTLTDPQQLRTVFS
jgi:CRP/FNR family transcriptional regulator